jgi:hypothetical protein
MAGLVMYAVKNGIIEQNLWSAAFNIFLY